MAFNTFLALGLFFAAAVLAMLLADGSSWVREHSWLLPFFKWAGITCGAFALISTKWARTIIGRLAIDQEQMNRKVVKQETHGSHSPTYLVEKGTLQIMQALGLGPAGNSTESAEVKYTAYNGTEFMGDTEHAFHPARGLDDALKLNDDLHPNTAVPLKIVYRDVDKERCTIQDIFYDFWTSGVRVETRDC